MEQKKKWIFFDIGSTIIDETEAYDHRVRDMIANTNITFEEFDNIRIAFATQGLDGNSAAIEHFGLTKTPWHSESEILYPDVAKILKTLYTKGYKLGIIANQNPGTQARLEFWGVHQYFDIIAASAEIGYAKPDIRIFEKAFEIANCTANECIMVGDRLDNDIVPAKSLGMTTIWIKQGLAKYQNSSFGNDIADYQIYSLSEILHII